MERYRPSPHSRDELKEVQIPPEKGEQNVREEDEVAFQIICDVHVAEQGGTVKFRVVWAASYSFQCILGVPESKLQLVTQRHHPSNEKEKDHPRHDKFSTTFHDN